MDIDLIDEELESIDYYIEKKKKEIEYETVRKQMLQELKISSNMEDLILFRKIAYKNYWHDHVDSRLGMRGCEIEKASINAISEQINEKLRNFDAKYGLTNQEFLQIMPYKVI